MAGDESGSERALHARAHMRVREGHNIGSSCARAHETPSLQSLAGEPSIGTYRERPRAVIKYDSLLEECATFRWA